MAGNNDLQKAGKAKQDEFYTQLSDIEKEFPVLFSDFLLK